MLTIPAAISGHIFKDLKRMMVGATVLGMVFTTVGLWVSYRWNLTSGASIILVAGLAYLLSLALAPLRARWVEAGA
jgi:zinc transport system permease protein